MDKRASWVGLGLAFALASAAQASAADRFEVSSIKALRPSITATLTALQKKDLAGARAAFRRYDNGWLGIEVYINTRSKDLYNALELTLQAKVDKDLASPMPDLAATAADTQALLAKYDEAVATVAAAQPLAPIYDDIARLRIERSNLRDVVPLLKEGDVAAARKAYAQFDDNWDPIEDLIKARSIDAYTTIERDMIQIEQALMPDKPDMDKVQALITEINMQYNGALQMIMKDARASA
jgi:hypothetical protein